MARRALLAGIALVAVAGLAWAVEPVRTRILIVAGIRAAGETSIGETCEDLTIGSGLLPELAIPPGALRVEVGQSIQEVLDQAGSDGTVVLASGIHIGQSVVPQAGQTILGEPGALVRGEGAPFAFRSASPNVAIRGLVIEGYEPDDKQGVVQGEEGARGWTVSGNEVRNNAEVGIVAKSGWTVTDNRVHHNGRYGIIGSGAQLLIEGNEIACNALVHGSTSDSAATKFVHTTDIVIRNNSVHDNFGNGLWVDINNVDFRIEGNRAEGNAYSGIFVEISCGGVVRDNDVLHNGFGTTRPAGMEHAGIYVTNSPGVEVAENRVTENAKGIGAIHWAHGNRVAVDRCVPELRDLSVHNNQISQRSGLIAGIDATIDLNLVWTDWGNAFTDNSYDVGPEARFRWEGSTIERGEWESLGLG